uniref:Bombolitin-4 n=2 Tax=Bombus TaxID=28641 RepID=BOL4_BOMPE|nr:RecName: Full=Bombolitin-4; AltName: Full=Bombolitin IV [Bombus pensylvanicus]
INIKDILAKLVKVLGHV